MNIIVATDKNGLIGDSKTNSLLWSIPDEMKFFSKKTHENIVVMGRKTFESIPEKFRPLPRRISCVLSHDEDWKNEQRRLYDKVYFLDSLDDIPLISYKYIDKEIYIIGGGSIYKEALENYSTSIDRVYHSIIYGDYAGDIYFSLKALYENFTLEKTLISHPQFQTNVYKRRTVL